MNGIKSAAIVVAMLFMTASLPLHAIGTPLPKSPTREQIIASCICVPTTVERIGLQQTKTRIEAAELLQSIYEDRFKVAYAASMKFGEYGYSNNYISSAGFLAAMNAASAEFDKYLDATKVTKALLETLHAEPITRKKTSKR